MTDTTRRLSPAMDSFLYAKDEKIHTGAETAIPTRRRRRSISPMPPDNPTTKPTMLDGNTLRLSPAQFNMLQQTILSEISLGGNATNATETGLRAIGLTDDQIEIRRSRDTKVVVSYGQ